jgi:hypothetical protein
MYAPVRLKPDASSRTSTTGSPAALVRDTGPVTDPGDVHHRHSHHPDLPDGIDPIGVPDDDADYRSLIVALAVVAIGLVLCTTVGWIAYHHFAR